MSYFEWIYALMSESTALLMGGTHERSAWFPGKWGLRTSTLASRPLSPAQAVVGRPLGRRLGLMVTTPTKLRVAVFFASHA
ncbi:hypothetical protein [Nonomuraea antimicrobica]|uniref:hypothetical protein n=1 Tax=Nonomuraea antimicrobica TaxID=561173 RepID=UPI0031EFFD88